jgi:peptide/nickel transport system substrate-binding protein
VKILKFEDIRMSDDHKAGKKKLVKKKIYRNPIVVSGLIAIIAVAGILGGLFFFMIYNIPNPDVVFICALEDSPNSIDPLKNPTTKHENLMIFDQVAEGLFDYDRYNSSTPIIPNLALEGKWSADGLNFTCYLREGVKFHDGTPFNATAVKWNFERILRFIDIMPHGDIWPWAYAFFNTEGINYINHTEVIDVFTIRFVLNQPYVPLKDLLLLWNSYILSPTSTPEDQFIDIETGKLIGTGPFILDSYELNYESEIIKAEFLVNPYYWGIKPKIDNITFIVITDEIERMEWMIAGNFSYAHGNADDFILENYRNATNIKISEKPGQGFWYIPLNNLLINKTMRKAISFAFNYTDFIETVHGGYTERLKSPLPRIMRYSSNLDMPYLNISRARQILKNANWPGTALLTANDNITSGNEWEMLAKSADPLSIHNFSVVLGSWGQPITANIMRIGLEQIGVKLNIINMSIVDFWPKMEAGELEIYTSGWGLAFLDPVEVINPIFSNGLDGEGNNFHFNDSLVQEWMEEAIRESNENHREQLYMDIQQRLLDLNPILWLDSSISYDIWDSRVKGISYEGAPFKFHLKKAYFG